MALDSKNPLYTEFAEDWQTMRDCYRGERVVKSRNTTYLPATSGMIHDGMAGGSPGWKAYQAYKLRALFPDETRQAVETLLGMLHHKPASFELPPELEYLREKATPQGETLQQLLRRINEQQLVTGRLGLLLDLPNTLGVNPNPAPYITLYHAEHIINWGLNSEFVVLDESGWEPGPDMEWQQVTRYRVLDATGASLRVRVGSGDDIEEITPQIKGETLRKIPFAFINAKDTTPTPDDPPLIGLAKLCLCTYRGEADYRQALFLQGQATLVVEGATEDNYRVGAGASILLNSVGKAYFLEVSGAGLSEMRQALENDKTLASAKAAQLVDRASHDAASGDALRVRLSGQTATLQQIAKTAAAGLEERLKEAAEWVGADPAQVKVTPNTDFIDDLMTGQDLLAYVQAARAGAPLSDASIHALALRRGVTTMQLQDELAEIAKQPVPKSDEESIQPPGQTPEKSRG